MSVLLQPKQQKLLNIFWSPQGGIFVDETSKERGGEKSLSIGILYPKKIVFRAAYVADTSAEKGVLPKVYIKKEADAFLVAIVFKIAPAGYLFLEEVLDKIEIEKINKITSINQASFSMVTCAHFPEKDAGLRKLLSNSSGDNIRPFLLLLGQKDKGENLKILFQQEIFYYEENLPEDFPELR